MMRARDCHKKLQMLHDKRPQMRERFLCEWDAYVDVKVRWGVRKRSRQASTLQPYRHNNRCGEGMGYILEDHLVTLSRGWR